MLVGNGAASWGVREIAFFQFLVNGIQDFGQRLAHSLRRASLYFGLDVVAAARHLGEGYVKAESGEGLA